MSKELDTLFPESEIVLGGETIKVSPFRFGQFPQVIKKMRGVASAMDGDDFGSIASIVDLIALGGDDILDLVSIALKKDREWVDELTPEDGAKAISIVIESNYDFFELRVLPVISSTMERLSKKKGKSQSKK